MYSYYFYTSRSFSILNKPFMSLANANKINVFMKIPNFFAGFKTVHKTSIVATYLYFIIKVMTIAPLRYCLSVFNKYVVWTVW